jgi:hypothetical protein
MEALIFTELRYLPDALIAEPRQQRPPRQGGSAAGKNHDLADPQGIPGVL